MADMANKVLITTDCVCDLTEKLIEEFELPIMYYYIQTEEARFQDRREILSGDLIEYIETEGKKAYSGTASKEEYREFFKKQREKTDAPIIHICMAKRVSEVYNVASQAVEGMENIHIVDSGHLSGGMGLMVLIAADMARCGASCDVILKELERLREKISSSFVVDSTQCLYRNGKISKNIYTLCSNFALHPILHLTDSKMKMAGICMGDRKRFTKTYLNKVIPNEKDIQTDIIFVITAGCTYEFQQYLKEEVEKRASWNKVIVNEASATVSCNCGSGAFGVLFLRR